MKDSDYSDSSIFQRDDCVLYQEQLIDMYLKNLNKEQLVKAFKFTYCEK